jgi:hypothetical protein
MMKTLLKVAALAALLVTSGAYAWDNSSGQGVPPTVKLSSL